MTTKEEYELHSKTIETLVSGISALIDQNKKMEERISHLEGLNTSNKQDQEDEDEDIEKTMDRTMDYLRI